MKGRNVVIFRFFAQFLTLNSLLWISAWCSPGFVSKFYNVIARILLGSIVVYNILPSLKRMFFRRRVSPQRKAVLITGCDTGFGHELAKTLDAQGFLIFAGCLFPFGEGAQALKKTCSNSFHVLGLDVTSEDNVKDVLKYVESNLHEHELWAVVNNAGILKVIDIGLSRVQDYQQIMDVNTMGVVRVTKAFLPLLKKSKGRVITMNSLASHIPMPSSAYYCMSKYETFCFCECLRQEMLPWGVKVIGIEPEFFKTFLTNCDSFQSKLADCMNYIGQATIKDYGGKFLGDYEKAVKSLLKLSSGRLHKVLDCLEDAVYLEEPNNVYKPCRNTLFQFIFFIGKILPQPIRDWFIQIIQNYLKFPQPKKARF